MKGMAEYQVNRSKTLVLKMDEEGSELLRNRVRKEVSTGLQKKGRVQYVVKSNRKNESSLTNLGRKEVEVSRVGSYMDPLNQSENDSIVARKKRRQTERNQVFDHVKKSVWKKGVSSNRPLGTPRREWKEQVVRVGTGYRVRKDEKNPRKRRFDVGYSDLKSYTRKEGREATVEGSNMGRTIVGKGTDARVKVINAVCAMEKRREVSEYTGSGIMRKSRVGKLKLKPTKPSGKE